MQEIAKLRPFQKKVEVVGKVLSKNEVREVTSKLDNSSHQVTEALIGDATGSVLLTLWDETIEQVEVGKSYKVENAYTSLFKKSIRLNIGRFGKFTEADNLSEVNESNNISEKEFDLGRRREY